MSKGIQLHVRTPRPAPVTDLVAVTSNVVDGAVLLQWTAVGHSAKAGQAVQYEIACSSVANIANDSDWLRSDVSLGPSGRCFASPVPSPMTAGSPEVFITTGLIHYGATYYFAVRAVNSVGRRGVWLRSAGNNENNFARASDIAPQPPANIRMNFNIYHHAAQVFWSASPNNDVERYRLYRTTTAGFSQNVIVATVTPSLSWLDLGLDNGVTFYYRVASLDRGGFESLPSASTGIWTHPPMPTPATNFRIAELTTSTVRWAWTPGSAIEGGQRIIELESGLSVTADLSTTTAEYTETGYLAGAFISTRAVVSFNLTGAVQSSPLYAYTVPNKPSDFNFAFVGTSVAISWNANGNSPLVDYYVLRSFDGQQWQTVAATKAVSYTDATLAEGASVYFKMFAKNGGGVSTDFTPAISTFTLRLPPAAIDDLAAIPGSREGLIELRWTSPGDDGRYGELIAPAEFHIDYSTDAGAAIVYSPSNKIVISTRALPGSLHGYRVPSLTPGSTYYFGIFTKDNDGNVSPVSNIAQTWAQWDIMPPAAFEDLTVDLMGDTSAHLRWISPGDDGWTGILRGKFQIGVSQDSATFRSQADFESKARKIDMPVAVFPMMPQEAFVADLVSEQYIYFAIRSFDERSNVSPISNVVSKYLDNVPPPDVADLSIYSDTSTDNLNRLSWFVPASSDTKVLVLIRNTSLPNRALLTKGRTLLIATRLEDNSVVLSTMTPQLGSNMSYRDMIAGVESLYTTYYYLIVAIDNVGNVSSGRFTASRFRENIAPRQPMAPVGEALKDNNFILTWLAPRFNADGSAIADPSRPRPHEIANYEIYASSGLAGPWSLSQNLPAEISCYSVQTSGLVYFLLRSVDMFGNRSGESLIIDSLARVYALASDKASYAMLPAHAAVFLRPANNPYRVAIVIKAQELPQEEAGITYTAMKYWAEDAATGKVLENIVFPQPVVRIVLHYASQAGRVTFNSLGALGFEGQGAAPLVSEEPVPAQEADRNLGLYWDNGLERVKIYGEVDKADQTVHTDVVNLGKYYVQKLYRAMGFEFDISRVEPKIITPNGDGLNDVVIFRYSNPTDVKVTGKVFDLTGAYVADITQQGPMADSRLWDGKDSNGRPVPGGVYVFQIEAEGKIFNGTIVVAR
ncbi:MAG: gliding motility-associated C-terminal domain-containing protein [Elusimicrobia bacterium]|nr:gliding motility-associated C-terminal domain-containing protein [Elusimicrobiota bacterium]